MELFYSKNIATGETFLDSEESNHCVRVLRHRSGDEIHVIDGVSNLYRCRITDDSPKCVSFEIIESIEGWGSHPYHLHLAVAPPKNIDRFEWFAEKATEIGLDEITPLFGEYSERKVFKGERIGRILVSAAKQSHKSAVPLLHEAAKVKDFLVAQPVDALRLICYCDETESLGVSKIDIKQALKDSEPDRDIIIMIGPEGDFSRTEIRCAIEGGWQPVSLGDSRLRIETAALVATAAVYIDRI